MTNPNEPLVRRVTVLEESAGRFGARLDTIGAAVDGAGGRFTQIEQTLAQAITDFSPVGVRVEELSAAFQAANVRLVALEERVAALQVSTPPADSERVAALEATIAQLTDRLSSVEQARTRGGRLSSRLRSIEEKIDELKPTPEEPA